MRTDIARHRDPHPVPRAVLRASGVLVAVALLAVGGARLTGTPPSALPEPSVEASAREIVMARNDQGGIIVTDAETGETIADLDMQQAGFIAGVDRALDRERMKAGLPPDLPVRLVRWQNGRLSLVDPVTDWDVELIGFGPDNEAAFARLLD